LEFRSALVRRIAVEITPSGSAQRVRSNEGMEHVTNPTAAHREVAAWVEQAIRSI